MNNSLFVNRISVILLLLVAIVGCGKAHIKTLQEPINLSGYNFIYVAPAKVSSKEQTEQAKTLNAKWVLLAKETVTRTLKKNRKYTISERPAQLQNSLTLDTTIDIVYGSRALRYKVGFGAGAGSCTVRLTLKDSSSGEVKYEVENKTDLSVGLWGGSMDKLIKKNIKGVVKQLGRQI